MRDENFRSLKSRLLESGVSPKHVRRIVIELRDHHDDLVDECLAGGASAEEAVAMASARIGDPGRIADRILGTPELRTWIYRYPRVARLYLPVAYALLLPAAPVFAGIANPGVVMRWGAALMLSAGVTAAMLLSMQLAIVLT
jgi:hypothetical protein